MSTSSATALLLSGGVDSSVALLELRRARVARVVAFYLKIWLEEDASYMGDCPWQEDLQYARAVCRLTGTPLKIISLQREYYEQIVCYTLEELRRGRTPSPDILCNRQIKFGIFRERAGEEFGCIASGHYARLQRRGPHTILRRAPDRVKDQTYFLSHLGQDQLRRLSFPIGCYTKHEVRRRARRYGLPNRDRRDSQGICFLGSIRYTDFVRHYLGVRRGAIVEEGGGRYLGSHDGHWFYTIGQRRGLGLEGGPWYVVGKQIAENVVYVAHARAGRARNRLLVEDLHWIAAPPDARLLRGGLQVKLRHTPKTTPCRFAVARSDCHQGPRSS